MATEISFSVVGLQHQLWRSKLRSFLDGHNSITPDEAVSYRDCVLGQWIYTTGKPEYGDKYQLIELEKIHITFHDEVKRVVELKNNGKVKEAEEAYQKVKKLSDQVNDLLDSLEAIVK